MKKVQIIFTLAFVASIFSTINVNAQTPAMPQAQQQVDVSEQDLTKFANVYKEIQKVGMEATQKVTTLITNEGMEVARFNEIHKATLNPNTENDANEAEMKKHDAIVKQLEGMQGEFQNKMEAVVKAKGMTMARYQALGQAIQSDKDLMAKLQAKMMAGAQNNG